MYLRVLRALVFGKVPGLMRPSTWFGWPQRWGGCPPRHYELSAACPCPLGQIWRRWRGRVGRIQTEDYNVQACTGWTVLTSRGSSRVPLSRHHMYPRYSAVRAGTRATLACSQAAWPWVRFVRIHTAICRQPPQPPRAANAQRTPDWTPVTTAAETHVPASPSCGVATWATWYQAPKTAKLPLWGGPRLHGGGAGAKNASCFFGRTLRNVHFGNARSTPAIAYLPTPRRTSPSRPSVSSPSAATGQRATGRCAHATHATRPELYTPTAGQARRQRWHDLT